MVDQEMWFLAAMSSSRSDCHSFHSSVRSSVRLFVRPCPFFIFCVCNKKTKPTMQFFFIFIASTNLLLNENIMALKPRLKLCQSLFSHILLSSTVICWLSGVVWLPKLHVTCYMLHVSSSRSVCHFFCPFICRSFVRVLFWLFVFVSKKLSLQCS